MTIVLNDEPHPLDPGTTVAELVRTLELTPGAFAIAVNGAFVPRSRYDEFELHEADAVELVAPMAGG